MALDVGTLIRSARRINPEAFTSDFGGIASEIIELVDGQQAIAAIRRARAAMEQAPPLPGVRARLRRLPFGQMDTAPELLQGKVAAIDGTFALPLQRYTFGEVLGIGIGSLSYRESTRLVLQYCSMSGQRANTANHQSGLQAASPGSPASVMRYFELAQGLDLTEEYLFFDGPLLEPGLMHIPEGLALYDALWSGGKHAIGVIKSLHLSSDLASYTRALRSGECFIIETTGSALQKLSRTTADPIPIVSVTQTNMATIARGIFKPAHKTFGFEVRVDQLDEMLRILAADCQLSQVGHEIPHLLNRVDLEVRRAFDSRVLLRHISAELAARSEELCYEESNERTWR